jgi:cobyrinic acid a,c-diamide synthase
MKIPAFIVAGTHSGCGKTTVTLGLMAALRARGYRVQPFKIGPDFIDPGHHARITGRASHNLDGWILDQRTNQEIFVRMQEDADVLVGEGVMGLFDGFSATDDVGSTAQMAKWLGLPVLLVVDARSMARSVAALVQGYTGFDPVLSFAGVLCNRVGSPGHARILQEALVAAGSPSCLGCLPRQEDLAMPSRHLGLYTADDMADDGDVLPALIQWIEDHVHVDSLLNMTGGRRLEDRGQKTEVRRQRSDVRSRMSDVRGQNSEIRGQRSEVRDQKSDVGGQKSEVRSQRSEIRRQRSEAGDEKTEVRSRRAGSGGGKSEDSWQGAKTDFHPKVRIGLARDRAFCFYYPENLRLLEQAGAELVPFSPLSDAHLPDNVQGIYLGGGYPELYADKLAANRSMREELKRFTARGGAVYAECGGFMYCMQSLEDVQGHTHPMLGLFPFRARMNARLRALGYREVQLRRDSLLGPAGTILRGHEFHYSSILEAQAEVERVYCLRGRKGGAETLEGYAAGNVLASYVHLHFASCPRAAQSLVRCCRASPG